MKYEQKSKRGRHIIEHAWNEIEQICMRDTENQSPICKPESPEIDSQPGGIHSLNRFVIVHLANYPLKMTWQSKGQLKLQFVKQIKHIDGANIYNSETTSEREYN